MKDTEMPSSVSFSVQGVLRRRTQGECASAGCPQWREPPFPEALSAKIGMPARPSAPGQAVLRAPPPSAVRRSGRWRRAPVPRHSSPLARPRINMVMPDTDETAASRLETPPFFRRNLSFTGEALKAFPETGKDSCPFPSSQRSARTSMNQILITLLSFKQTYSSTIRRTEGSRKALNERALKTELQIQG